MVRGRGHAVVSNEDGLMVGGGWTRVGRDPVNLEAYRITSLIGRDPFAVIVRAVELATGTVVAIRIGSHVEPPTIVGRVQGPAGVRAASLRLVDDAIVWRSAA